jgi:hypothetical protein
MAHWRKKVSGDNPNLHVWDIEDVSPVTVTIESDSMGEVHSEDGADKAMYFLHFKGGKKPLGVNAVNGTIIAAHHGNDTDNWIGKKIQLRTATLTSGPREGTECIRVAMPDGLKLPGNCHRFRFTDKIEKGDKA